MKSENRKTLRDALVGKQVMDVVFHDSHGLIIDIILSDNTTMAVCTYEDPDKNLFGDFYVSINGQEI